MRKRLFQPLGMSTAGFGAMGTPGKVDQPWQHTEVDGKWTPVAPGPLSDNPPAIGPGGTVHMSLGDWAKYAIAHLQGARGESRLLKRETWRKLHTPLPPGDYAFGWGLLLLATFLIDHFDLFGLRQAWYGFRGEPMPPLEFRTPWLYRRVRHPLYVGWIFIFWSTPTMTVGHLLFAIATTAYILIAVRFEERYLVDAHPEYAEYRKRVPMLVPRLGPVGDASAAKPAAAG